ncbi:MAG: ParB/RepB/Spo0J family partition protein [Bacteriovoracaceae bacterium]
METRQLSELKATNPYLRLGTDVTELEKSIKTLGLIAPLVITEDNIILAGARRYQALLNLGHAEAPVMVKTGTALEKELVSIDENLVRKDLSKIEIESHLRRAKEIYLELNPPQPKPEPTPEEAAVEIEVLPAQEFLEMVSEKTGLSPKQIHEAINRDEKASEAVKEARKAGELSVGQTNEIVKLNKEDQEEAIEIVKELPVKDIRKFVKMAKAEGIDRAIARTPVDPRQREFQEFDQQLKKVIKKLKQFELEGITSVDLPDVTQDLLLELVTMSGPGVGSERSYSNSEESIQ